MDKQLSIWFPILQQWWQQLYTPGTSIYLALDRTQWDDVNLLVVSWIYHPRAIPIYCSLIPTLAVVTFGNELPY